MIGCFTVLCGFWVALFSYCWCPSACQGADSAAFCAARPASSATFSFAGLRIQSAGFRVQDSGLRGLGCRFGQGFQAVACVYVAYLEPFDPEAL